MRARPQQLIHTLAMAIVLPLLVPGCSNKEPEEPPVPLSISFRPAILDKSLVAQFKNTSNRYLTVLVRLENRTLRQVKNHYITIAPLEMQEFGWAEGWKFMSGEYISLAHEDYTPAVYRVP